MRYGRMATVAFLLFFLFGCSSNDSPRVPSCDDERVANLLEKIVASNDMELSDISDIQTESESPEECRCKAKARIKYDGMEREGPFEYAVKLQENKEDFTVKILME